MVIQPRNFSATNPLNACTTALPPAPSGLQVFALRSLPPFAADEIPRRFSSSSLPPSFASGRFAVLCIPPHRSPRRAAACRG
jgi:hypothetical protein